jgi:hypothetical protein
VRYVLKNYNALTPQVNWFNPASYSTTTSSFYGMPWEIFRTDRIIPSTSRPVTFVTKGGSHPGYNSIVIMLPEYDLGITILTAGPASLIGQIRELITVSTVNAAEEIAQSNLEARYTGIFTSENINSSLVLAHTDTKGLFIDSFISNSTDVISAWESMLGLEQGSFRIQIIPTLLYRDEKSKKGEIWRGLIVPEKREPTLVWDEFCLTDQDPSYYGRKAIFEMAFWFAEDGREILNYVDLSAFRTKLWKRHGKAISQNLYTSTQISNTNSHGHSEDVSPPGKMQIQLGQ